MDLLPPSTRVTTFNVEYARRPEQIADQIKNNPRLRDTDILLLQEIESYAHEGKGRAESIATALGYACMYAAARETGTGGTHGIAILTKHPLEEVRVVPLRFYNLRYNSRTRIALTAVARVRGETLRIYNIHLDTRLNAHERIEQLRPAVDDANRHAEDKIIMAGDFNTLPFYWLGRALPVWWANQYGPLDTYLKSCGFTTTSRHMPPTAGGKFLRLHLDHIYVRNLDIVGAGVEEVGGVSDHKPLWADIHPKSR